MAKNAKNAKAGDSGHNPFSPEGKEEAVRLLMARKGKTFETRFRGFLKSAPAWMLQSNGLLRSPIRRRIAAAAGQPKGLLYYLESQHAGVEVSEQLAQRYGS